MLRHTSRLSCTLAVFSLVLLGSPVSGHAFASATPGSASIRQAGPCTGVVIDEQGSPVPGASVRVKNSSLGAITDMDGKFSIKGVRKDAVLTISFVGYEPLEVSWTGTPLRITLKEDRKTLDEVVVVGYGVQKKRDLTGAISSVKMDDAPVNTFSTISHALAGKAAGLQVRQTSAQVGGSTTFRIRGAGSISAGNDPLIIIDGFPVSSSGSLGSGTRYNAGSTDNVLSSLNPNDIESIEVLKDASSTAIYGSRAGHGVIIITTKRGKANKPKVSYSSNFSLQQVSKQYMPLDAKEYMIQRNRYTYEDYLKKNGLEVYASYLPAKPDPKPFVPSFSQEQIAQAQTTNWFDEVSRNGRLQSHNISLSGGTEKTQYLISLNVLDQAGIVKNNNLKKFTGKVNLDQVISDYVKTGISLNASRNILDNSALGEGQFENAGILSAAAMFNPSIPVYDKDGKYSENPDFSQLPNPVSLLEIKDRSTKDRFLASGYVEVKPLKDLILKANIGMDRQYEKRKVYLPKTTMYGASANGQASIQQQDKNDYLMELTATYIKSFGDHSLTGLLGYSYQQFNYEWMYAGNQDFLIDSFLYNNLGAGNYAKPSVGSSASKSSLGSYFGRLNYSYLGKYLVTATLRADGASNFDPAHRWGYFPSLSLGWRFSDEEFMKNYSRVLSNGKLRASYGQTGNSNVGNRVLDFFQTGYNNVFGNTAHTGVVASQLGNPNLTWETTSEFNIGLELGFFRNRISATIEYYNRTISDLLVTGKSLPSYNEISTIAANIGATQSRGLELTLNTVNLQSADWDWTTDYTFSFYRDRWKERDPNWKPSVYQKPTDYIRSIYTYVSDGLLQPNEKAPEHQPTLLPGQVKLKDLNGDKKIDDNDVILRGHWDPGFTFGLNNTLRYKRLDLNVYLYGTANQYKGASYYDEWAMMGYGLVQGRNSSKGYKETWTHDNPNAKYPNILGPGDRGVGDYFIRKISFLRCRNITLGYTFDRPFSLLNRVRLYADLNNPFVLTNWNGLDPETDTHQYSYPNSRSFSLGVDLTF